jgi:group I intron endonuclease
MTRGVIYKITSPTGRVYIGQTINLVGRERFYKNKLCKSQRRLYNSIIKHGWDAHTIEIIEKVPSESLNDREVYWIKHFDSCNSGLNLNHGGAGNSMTEEARKRLSIIRKASPKGAVGKRGKDHYMYGKSTPTAVRLKQSEARIGRFKGKDSPSFKGYITAYNSEGIVVGVYEGVNDAAAHLSIFHSNISKVLIGKRQTVNGLSFKRN